MMRRLRKKYVDIKVYLVDNDNKRLGGPVDVHRVRIDPQRPHKPVEVRFKRPIDVKRMQIVFMGAIHSPYTRFKNFKTWPDLPDFSKDIKEIINETTSTREHIATND